MEAKISSFDQNPERGNIPAIDRQAIKNVIEVLFIFFESPPIS